MNEAVSVCIVVITICILFLLFMCIRALQDMRKIRIKTEIFLENIEKEISPLISDIRQVAEDARQITHTVRCQFEKVDSTTDVINQNIHSMIEKWIATLDSLHDAVAEPIGDIVAFLKGVSKGVSFFFNNGKAIKEK